MMATAAAFVLAEVEELVPIGGLEADGIHTPGNYIDRVVVSKPRKSVSSSAQSERCDPPMMTLAFIQNIGPMEWLILGFIFFFVFGIVGTVLMVVLRRKQARVAPSSGLNN